MLRRRSRANELELRTQELEQRVRLSEHLHAESAKELSSKSEELLLARTRIADLEGAPAAREHAGRARELESVEAKLAAAEQRAAFEQEVRRERFEPHTAFRLHARRAAAASGR